MNEDIKTRWIAALRSGEYRQTGNVLNNGEAFCCLGVLSDLAVKDGLKEWDTEKDYEYGIETHEPGDAADETYTETLSLPYDVAVWAGLQDEYAISSEIRVQEGVSEFDGLPITTTLAALNDKGSSFSEIADIIEKKL